MVVRARERQVQAVALSGQHFRRRGGRPWKSQQCQAARNARAEPARVPQMDVDVTGEAENALHRFRH